MVVKEQGGAGPVGGRFGGQGGQLLAESSRGRRTTRSVSHGRLGPRSSVWKGPTSFGSWPRRRSRCGRRRKESEKVEEGKDRVDDMAGALRSAWYDGGYTHMRQSMGYLEGFLGISTAICTWQSLVRRCSCLRSTVTPFFWEMTSGYAVFGSLLGSTVSLAQGPSTLVFSVCEGCSVLCW